MEQITINNIEEKIAEYMIVHGHKPRFVLLDKASHSFFTKFCYAKERIVGRDGTILSPENPPKIDKIYSTSDCIVEILPVDVSYSLFEIVR